MASSRGLNPAAEAFNSSSNLLEDPFGPSSPFTEIRSTASAPGMASCTTSAGSSPVRETQSLTASPEVAARGFRTSFARNALSIVSCSPGSPEAGSASTPGTSYGIATPASRIRSDRMGQQINDENAQGYFGTAHSVFFGNLPRSMSNDALQERLKLLLEKRVGTCYVAISRDKDDMPVAFASFENATHAQQALIEGPELIIGNRPLRAETPKGNFTFVVFKPDGKPVTQDDIEILFDGKGPIERTFRPDPPMRIAYDLHVNCLCVEMGTFGDYRDARRAFLRTNLRGISVVPMTHLASSNQGYPRGFAHMRPAEERVSDMLSVYVGNLPPGCTAENVQAFCKSYGYIKKVQLGGAVNAEGARVRYAFVEFTEPRGVCQAVSGVNGMAYRHRYLRAEFRSRAMNALNARTPEARAAVAGFWNTYRVCPTVAQTVDWLNRQNINGVGIPPPVTGHTSETLGIFYAAWVAADQMSRLQHGTPVIFHSPVHPATYVVPNFSRPFYGRHVPTYWAYP